jgi:hypothetical protein
MFEFIIITFVIGGFIVIAIKSILTGDEYIRPGDPEYNEYKAKEVFAKGDLRLKFEYKTSEEIIQLIDLYYSEARNYIDKNRIPMFKFGIYKFKIRRKLKKIVLNGEISSFEEGIYELVFKNTYIKSLQLNFVERSIKYDSKYFDDFKRLEYVNKNDKMIQLKLILKK